MQKSNLGAKMVHFSSDVFLFVISGLQLTVVDQGEKIPLPVKAKVLKLVLTEELQSFQVWTFGLSRNNQLFSLCIERNDVFICHQMQEQLSGAGSGLKSWGGTLRQWQMSW